MFVSKHQKPHFRPLSHILKDMNLKPYFDKGFTYAEYRKLVSELYTQGRVTGPTQTESLLEYTRLNQARMERWDKTFAPDPNTVEHLRMVAPEVQWLVISEGWCGDASQNLPLLAKLAEAAQIQLRVVLRDENLELIDAHLTNGGRAIPKLIVADRDFNTLSTWGPRPAEIQAQVTANKQTNKLDHDEMSLVIHTWYARNKGQNLQSEMVALHQNLRQLA